MKYACFGSINSVFPSFVTGGTTRSKCVSINFVILCELENLGLIRFDALQGFIRTFSKKEAPGLSLTYSNKTAIVVDYPDEQFPAGDVILTEVGICIASIIEKEEVEGYWDKLVNYLTSKNVIMRQ